MSPRGVTGAGVPGAGDLPVLAGPGFVGRSGELTRLIQVLAGQPRVVLISGESGIGKTRLLAEALRAPNIASRRLVVTRCPPVQTPFTLGAVVDGIREHVGDVAGLGLSGLAGALRPVFPEWVRDLPPAPEPAADATAERHRLFRALGELLACLDVAVFAVEDVHWADQATLEFLLFVAARVSPSIAIVVTWRPEDIPEWSLLSRLARLAAGATGASLALGPLDKAATTELVSSMLGGQEVPGEAAEFVHRRTDGVPLMAEELVRLVHGQVGIGAQRWTQENLNSIGVPESIRAAILERVSRLDSDARAVLRATAILAAPAAEATVAEVCGPGLSSVRNGLLAGLASGLLAEDARGLVTFRHALAASAVADATPVVERRVLHLRAGQALAALSPPPLSRLAWHFREAGEAASWCRYGEAVADVALATGNEESAAEVLFDLVTEAGLPAADLARLVGKFPFGSSDSPLRCRHLASVLDSAVRTDGLAPSIEGDIRWQLARVLIKCDDFPSACEQIERAIPSLAHDPLNAGRAMIQLCQLSWSDWPAATRLDWLRRGETIAAPDKPADQLELIVDRAMTLLRFGEDSGWADAQKIPADAADPRVRLQAVRGLGATSHMAMVWGRYAEARKMLGATLDLAETHRYTRYRYCKVTRAHLDWFTGAWDNLAERAQQLAGIQDAPPAAHLEAVLIGGLVEAACGNRLAAEDRFRAVLDQARHRLTPEFLMEPAAALAGVLLALGQVDDAVSVTEEPVAVLARIEAWVWASEIMPARVRALVAAGQRRKAADLTAAFAAWLDGRNAPAPLAALTTCQAMVADAAGQAVLAARLFAAAADTWRALPRPYDALLADEQRARCLVTAGHEEATGLLTRTAQGLTALGAANDAARVARLLRERGVEIRKRGWHGGRKSYGDWLSPREAEVVRLLAAGRSNQEIAKALGKSPHTVDSQVRSAMRKLGVSSRITLAVRAVEMGVAR